MTAPVLVTVDQLARLAGHSIDQRGVRFELDGRVLRAFRGEAAGFYRSLLGTPTVEELFNAGLIRTWISDVSVEGYELVIESERVPVVTYPVEWPTAAIHEAALVTARLGRALAERGLGMVDAHPWNVLFDGSRGRWIDVGSIVDAREVVTQWRDEFRAHAVLPLALHAHRWHSMANLLSAEHRVRHGKAIWQRRPLRWYPLGYRRLSRHAGDPRKFFAALVEYLERLRPIANQTEWSGYVQAPGVTPGDRDSYDGKQSAVDMFLARLPAGQVLDVGANAGWFSELAARYGHRVIAIDTDDTNLSALFDRARHVGLPISTVMMDIMWPTGSFGLGLTYPAAPERLRSNVTLWLAVLHHLVGRQGFTFEAVARTIDQFTVDAAIVEFVPRSDRYVREWAIANAGWYEPETFVRAMRRYFPSVEVIASSPAPRQMMLFQRA